MTHIALVHPYSWPDVRRGGERYLDDLAAYLAGAGHSVDVITGTDGRSGVEHRDDGVVVRRRRHVLPVQMQPFGVSRVDTFGIPALTIFRPKLSIEYGIRSAGKDDEKAHQEDGQMK